MIETIPFKKILEGLGKLTKLKQEMSDIEFKEVIVELKSTLLDNQEAILNLRAENISLKGELDQIKSQASASKKLVEVSGFKYDVVDHRPSGWPYCPNCEVKEDGKFFRLIRVNETYSSCPNCKTDFNAGSNGLVHGDEPMSSEPYDDSDGRWTFR